jgi:hypothetical protein
VNSESLDLVMRGICFLLFMDTSPLSFIISVRIVSNSEL